MQKIETAISDVVSALLDKTHSEAYNYEAFMHDSVEIYAFSKSDQSEKYAIIRISVHNENKQIFIPNIFMPPLLKHKRIGKQLIRLIYELGQMYNYEVFVSQLTESFKERLSRRGAIATNEPDILKIVETTNLLGQQN